MKVGDEVTYTRVVPANYFQRRRTVVLRVVVMEILTKRVRVQLSSGVTVDVAPESLAKAAPRE